MLLLAQRYGKQKILFIHTIVLPDGEHDDGDVIAFYNEDDAEIEARRKRPFAQHRTFESVIIEPRICRIHPESIDRIRNSMTLPLG